MKVELVTNLKRQATRILADLHAGKEAVLITEHGQPSAYLVDVQDASGLRKWAALHYFHDKPKSLGGYWARLRIIPRIKNRPGCNASTSACCKGNGSPLSWQARISAHRGA